RGPRADPRHRGRPRHDRRVRPRPAVADDQDHSAVRPDPAVHHLVRHRRGTQGLPDRSRRLLPALPQHLRLYLNTYAGIRQLDPKLLELSRTLRLSLAERLRLLIVPGALPQILVGVRQSLGIAWLSLVEIGRASCRERGKVACRVTSW